MHVYKPVLGDATKPECAKQHVAPAPPMMIPKQGPVAQIGAELLPRIVTEFSWLLLEVELGSHWMQVSRLVTPRTTVVGYRRHPFLYHCSN